MMAPAYSAGVRTLQLNWSPFLLVAVLRGDRSCTDNNVFGGIAGSGSSKALAVIGASSAPMTIKPFSVRRSMFIGASINNAIDLLFKVELNDLHRRRGLAVPRRWSKLPAARRVLGGLSQHKWAIGGLGRNHVS